MLHQTVPTAIVLQNSAAPDSLVPLLIHLIPAAAPIALCNQFDEPKNCLTAAWRLRRC